MRRFFRFSFLFPLSILLFASCGMGDDDGRRLGELIVGTWQRGWGEGDVTIEGETDIRPENLTYDRFVFRDDGTYNGMVRKGSFAAYDSSGDLILEGAFQCDNNNLKLEPSGFGPILAQVVSFTDDTVLLRYAADDFGVTVTFVIRRQP